VQPPFAIIPSDPTDLSVLQRGGTIYAHFKLPELTTEQRPIKGDLELDLRAGVTPNPWSLPQWAAAARKFTPRAVEGGIAQYQFSSLAWTGNTITVAVRVIGANGKASNWSKGVTLPVVAPLAAPTDLKAESTAKGVRLAWRAPEQHFRILRRAERSSDFVEIGTSVAPEFLDSTAEFGKQYGYMVQAFQDLGEQREAQSDLTGEVDFAPIDKFPPAAPAGLRATASANSIELSWDANTEPDLASYRIYRAVGGGAFEKIGDVADIPTYSDRAVEAGKTYRYVVTAVDKSGNESARSAIAEAAL
jgi:fibronectin type 3 domain-containing protein